MSSHLIHVPPVEGESAEPAAWRGAAIEVELTILSAQTEEQAIEWIRRTPPAAVLIEEGARRNGFDERIERLAAEARERGVALIGLTANPPEPDEAERWTQAGMLASITPRTPRDLVFNLLGACAAVDRLRRFQAEGADSSGLARATRPLLHNLCQPLSALQGRLQLLHAKCPADDPLKPTYESLVGLALEVSKILRQIQDLHRRAG
jgi:signal transduction histidine kinase